MSEMKVKTVGAKFIFKSHGNLDTLTRHAKKTLSEIVNFILSIPLRTKGLSSVNHLHS